ncbi:Pilus assembly protein, PilO [Selenomonas sp. GACV-9]|uniref:type 4a pilus biogenesis protein PilO n=1 Tax=Selenomonas sp. GACV-9 TaxID=3158782 RepID=UPI0008E86788|nr:Pilus assembly protein, PilO [Selenomonas ruminantium]
MVWRQLAGKEWLTAAAGACMVLGLGVYFFIHQPLREMQQAAATEAGQVQAQIVQVTNYQNAHLDLVAYEEELTKRQELADKALPSALEQGAFLSMLQREALRNHMELQQVTPQAVQQQESLQVLPVEVRFRCRYFDLLAFLRGLRESERYVQVERIKVKQQDGILLCALQLRIYALPEGKSVDND